jgi:hypothetical protein
MDRLPGLWSHLAPQFAWHRVSADCDLARVRSGSAHDLSQRLPRLRLAVHALGNQWVGLRYYGQRTIGHELRSQKSPQMAGRGKKKPALGGPRVGYFLV